MKTLIMFLLLATVAQAQTLPPPQATLTWSYKGDPKGVAVDFPIERMVGPINSGNPWVFITAVQPGVLTYVDKAVQADIEYCYRVGARNAKGIAWTIPDAKSCGTSVSLVVPAAPVTLVLQMSQGGAGMLPVSVDWISPAKPSKTDWVGLFLASSPDTLNVFDDVRDYWVYTGAAPKGRFTITPPRAGTYNIRL